MRPCQPRRNIGGEHAGGCRCGRDGHWHCRGLGEGFAFMPGRQTLGPEIRLERKGRAVPAVLISLPGISVNGMARNPEDGRPGGAVRRRSRCQSAGSDQTMPTGRGAVNNYFQSNDFNGLRVKGMCKSGVLDR